MSSELALVGLSIVPPIAGLAIMYGRFVRKMTKEVQVLSLFYFVNHNNNN